MSTHTSTWRGQFKDSYGSPGASAGTNGLTQSFSLYSGSTLPSDANVTGVTYSLKLTADNADSSLSWRLFWFYAQYGQTIGAKIGTSGSSSPVATATASTSANYTFNGSLSFQNLSVFQNNTISFYVKGNISGSPRSYMWDASVTVTWEDATPPTPTQYTIAWNSGASLSAVQTGGTNVTFTLTGSAYTSPDPLSITYQLLESVSGEVVTIGTFSNGTLSTTADTGTHSYFVSASATPPNQSTIYASGPELTFTVSGPIVQFTSGASISFSASGGEATITLSGSASITNGYSGTIYYRVYEIYNSTAMQRNSDGDTSTEWTFVPYTAQDVNTGYLVDAYVVYGGNKYASQTMLSCSGTVPAPVLSWTAGSYISVEQSGDNAVVTLHGDAVVGGGFVASVCYRVWYGTVRKNQDGDTSKTWSAVPPQYDVSLTYTVRAYATIGGNEYESTNLTASAVIDGGNYVDYFNGTNWVQCKAYYFNGSGWVECKPFYFNGSNWVEISS